MQGFMKNNRAFDQYLDLSPKCAYETVSKLSNGTIFNELE